MDTLPGSFALFIITVILGRGIALYIYHSCWQDAQKSEGRYSAHIVPFLLKPPFLVPVILFSYWILDSSWDTISSVRNFAVVGVISYAVATIGRWGAIDFGRFFATERYLVLLLGSGVWFSPVFLLPFIFCTSRLQYRVAHSAFSPGYSNLLGYEFMRMTLCSLLSACFIRDLVLTSGLTNSSASVYSVFASNAFIFSAVLISQASYYVQQAIAKCFTGHTFFSWIRENRLQCLLINAYLRGWGKNKERVLSTAMVIGRFRVILCLAVWLIELSWILILADPVLGLVILALTFGFHLLVLMGTGLMSYHFMISHCLMLNVITHIASSAFNHFLLPGIVSILASTLWVLLLRRHLWNLQRKKIALTGWHHFFDPADHLMAWWDSPFMRMYSYSVTTVSRKEYHFPVTKFSPYDTFLTDIHTHLMIFRRDWEVDPYLDQDRKLMPTGVWGLTVEQAVKDSLYLAMDSPEQGLACLVSKDAGAVIESSELHREFQRFFRAINHHCENSLFRTFFRWPHFPGEDWVPDECPLLESKLETYKCQEKIIALNITCITTFYRKNAIDVLSVRKLPGIQLMN